MTCYPGSKEEKFHNDMEEQRLVRKYNRYLKREFRKQQEIEEKKWRTEKHKRNRMNIEIEKQRRDMKMDEVDQQQEIDNKEKTKMLATEDTMRDAKTATKDSAKKIVNDD